MAIVLLTSERFVKNTTNISDNVAGKYLLPAIREAQELGLKYIIGQELLTKLCSIVQTGATEGSFNLDYAFDCSVTENGENAWYLDLLSQVQYYLAYKSVAELAYKISYKIGNFGVTKGTDDNLQVASLEEIGNAQEYYQSKADGCAMELQLYLLENRTHFPELTETTCTKIQAHLADAASCGVFLGGARGKADRDAYPRLNYLWK